MQPVVLALVLEDLLDPDSIQLFDLQIVHILLQPIEAVLVGLLLFLLLLVERVGNTSHSGSKLALVFEVQFGCLLPVPLQEVILNRILVGNCIEVGPPAGFVHFPPELLEGASVDVLERRAGHPIPKG